MDRRRESIFFGCFFPWNHNFTLNVWSMSQSFVAHNFCFLLSGFLFPLILAHSIFSCVSLFNHFIIFFPFSGQNFCGDLVMMRLLYTHSIFHIKFEKKIPFLIEICVRFGGQVYISFREKIFALRRISRFYGILRKTRIRWYFQYFACILDYFDTPNLFEKSSFFGVCVYVLLACCLLESILYFTRSGKWCGSEWNSVDVNFSFSIVAPNPPNVFQMFLLSSLILIRRM